MGVRMFTTARQMETWSHAQAIYDLVGVERPPPSPRLRNIAEIGVRTFGWAYRNRGLPVPTLTPYVRLETPFGETWAWNDPSVEDAVRRRRGGLLPGRHADPQRRRHDAVGRGRAGAALDEHRPVLRRTAGDTAGSRRPPHSATEVMMAPNAIKPFRIAVADDVLADLRSRSHNTRWPEASWSTTGARACRSRGSRTSAATGPRTTTGGAREALLNRFPQFTTAIDGLDIHFVHAARRMPAPCRCSSPTAGRARSSSSTRSSSHWSIRSRTAATPPTPSTSSARRCRASASRASRAPPAGASIASRAPGRADGRGWATRATAPRAATGARR